MKKLFILLLAMAMVGCISASNKEAIKLNPDYSHVFTSAFTVRDSYNAVLNYLGPRPGIISLIYSGEKYAYITQNDMVGRPFTFIEFRATEGGKTEVGYYANTSLYMTKEELLETFPKLFNAPPPR